MFQSFETTSRPENGPTRLSALRKAMATADLDGFLVPRADAHQGEYVAECDARLAWLTGFTGSAGFAAVLPEIAGLFIDGRYRVQVRAQVDCAHFTPVNWPETALADWLKSQVTGPAVIGFDPWLHSISEIEALRKALERTEITLVETGNLIDLIWQDRPKAPKGPARAYPMELAGRSAAEKRAAIAEDLRKAGQNAAVVTLPDSIAWLLNIRGSDLPRVPVVQAFAVIHADGQVTMFADPEKLTGLEAHLGPEIEILPQIDFAPYLRTLTGTVRVDKASAPMAVAMVLAEGEGSVDFARDPCILPKACKTDPELEGTTAAHLRDGAAMVEFLCWLDAEADKLIADPLHRLTEIGVVRALEGFRRATNRLEDISFETICGAGPNGAIVHYRVTEDTNRAVAPGEILLVDSGGQYFDGTTDITRTVAIGPVADEARACFTRVLQGMIAISRVRFPKGIAGRDLDSLARQPLWLAGQDYDHGTGHGVGAFLSVHEGPQRISRASHEPLLPGMILSNEPGYYREGSFGIRIENLIVVEEAPTLAGADAREMRAFRTLTHVPIDLRLIDAEALSRDDRAWLNAYHAETLERLTPLLSDKARNWLRAATRAL